MKKFLVLLFLIAIGTSVYAQSDNIITEKGYVRGNYYNYASGDEKQHHFGYIDGVLFEMYSGHNSNGNPYNSVPNILVKFPQNKNVTTYTIPPHTFIIAKGAFQGNKYIQTIRIPSSVAYIGDDAFANCDNLKNIEVYDSSSSDQTINRGDVNEDGEVNIGDVNELIGLILGYVKEHPEILEQIRK